MPSGGYCPCVRDSEDQRQADVEEVPLGGRGGILPSPGGGQAAGILYVDGRVTVYHGRQTKLPRRYVARRLRRIAPARKHFLDTIKMIAYRAETAMMLDIREFLARPDDARALLRELFTATADILPDSNAQTLTVRLHHLANPLSTQAAAHLAQLLNQTETHHPATNHRLRYELVSNPNPANREF